MHLLTGRFLSVTFWRSKDDCRTPGPLLSRFGHWGLFPFPKVEVHPKRSPISDDRGDKRKFATGPSRHPAKHVPGRVLELEKNAGSGVSTVEREYFEGDKSD